MYCALNCYCCSRDIIIILSALQAYDGLLACRRVRKPTNKKNQTVFTDFCFTPIMLVLIIIILSSAHAAVVAVYYILTPKARIYRGYIYIYIYKCTAAKTTVSVYMPARYWVLRL